MEGNASALSFPLFYTIIAVRSRGSGKIERKIECKSAHSLFPKMIPEKRESVYQFFLLSCMILLDFCPNRVRRPAARKKPAVGGPIPWRSDRIKIRTLKLVKGNGFRIIFVVQNRIALNYFSLNYSLGKVFGDY